MTHNSLPKKIRVSSEAPEPNCRVAVEEGGSWEPRVYNEENSWVYTFHKGFLWPQRHSNKYYKIELVSSTESWQCFESYGIPNKE